MMSRESLDVELDELQARLLATIDECPREEIAGVLEEFASEADLIRFTAGREHRSHVQTRLKRMLWDAGLNPGQDEPC